MDFGVIGAIVIAIGWVVQLVYTWKGSKEIKKSFLIIYAIGLLLIVYDNYMSQVTNLLTMNILSIVLAVIVLLMLSFKKTKAVAVRRKKR